MGEGRFDQSVGGQPQSSPGLQSSLLAPPSPTPPKDASRTPEDEYPAHEKTPLQEGTVPPPTKHGLPLPLDAGAGGCHDWPWAVAFGVLFAFVLIWKALAFGPLALRTFLRMPLVALEFVPALVLGALLSLLGLYLFLAVTRRMASAYSLRVLGGIFALAYTAMGVHELYTEATMREFLVSQGPAAGAWSSYSIANGSFLVVIGLSVAACLVLCAQHYPTVARLVQESSAFLLGKGKAVMLLAVLVGLGEGLLFSLPNAVQMVALGTDCAAPAKEAFHILSQGMQDLSLANQFSDKEAAGALVKQDLLSVFRAFRMSSTCQPWIAAFFGNIGANLVLALFSGFLAVWLSCLVISSLTFLAASLISSEKKGNESGLEGEALPWKTAVSRCLTHSFGSLCLASFCAAALDAASIIIQLLLAASLTASPVAPVLLVATSLAHLFLRGFLSTLIVPGLAIYGGSFSDSCSKMWRLVLANPSLLFAAWIGLLPLILFLVDLSLLLLILGALATGLFAAIMPLPAVVPLALFLALGPFFQVILFADVVQTTVASQALTTTKDGGSDMIDDVEANPLVPSKHETT